MQKIHLAAHTLKGASRQVYCAALGTASEHVEHVIRRARDIAREPSLVDADAGAPPMTATAPRTCPHAHHVYPRPPRPPPPPPTDKEAARKEISAGMDEVSSTHMQELVTEARKFAVVVGKLDPEFIEEEAEDEVVERMEGAGADKFESELAAELAAFGGK